MVIKSVQTVSLLISFFLYDEVSLHSNIVSNTEYYFYSVKKSVNFITYRVNRQDAEYDPCKKLSFSDEESESEFEDFVYPLPPGISQ